MTKNEFMQELKAALLEELQEGLILSDLNYYSDYIDAKTAQGISQQEIFDELGDPRLIAHTIIDTRAMKGERTTTQRRNFMQQSNDSEQNEQNHSDPGSSGWQAHWTNGQAFPWYWKVLTYLILAGILVVTFAVGGFVLQIAFRLIVPITIVFIGYQLFRNMFR